MKGTAGLLGRSDELGALRAALDRAMAGQPAFVLLLGEPGIGKTRLLAAVAEEATARGLRPLVGTAIESGMALPYLPLMAALPGAFAGPPMPKATTDPTTDTDPADAASAARMVEAIHDAVVRVPSVLLLDDIQWADASTLTVLDYLAHRARDSRLAVVVAARDEPAALARLSIADGRRYIPIRLGGLGRGDVAGQIRELSGATPAPTVVERIYRRTDGNPFFVEQLVAAERGASETGPLPAFPMQMIGTTVNRCRFIAWATLTWMAIACSVTCRIASVCSRPPTSRRPWMTSTRRPGCLVSMAKTPGGPTVTASMLPQRPRMRRSYNVTNPRDSRARVRPSRPGAWRRALSALGVYFAPVRSAPAQIRRRLVPARRHHSHRCR